VILAARAERRKKVIVIAACLFSSFVDIHCRLKVVPIGLIIFIFNNLDTLFPAYKKLFIYLFSIIPNNFLNTISQKLEAQD
jgi:hypothetical protein